jgi:hypothetical protein
VWLDRNLGYGTYLVRFVGPVETEPADMTWSPFFLWDDTGNAGNGFREVDIEVARWGNRGDPTGEPALAASSCTRLLSPFLTPSGCQPIAC